ncbi:MAG: hypothetical protein K8T10_11450 [Candidatus Eremiobacteraeota bacterium]|nr:hypothetical protein [Candidatus Eremiobacteraeota bacterium]
MKRIVKCFLFIIIVLFSVFPAGESLADQMIVPGERIGNMHIGMKKQEMLKILGQPDKSVLTTAEGFREYQYMEKHLLIIDIDPGTDRIKYIATGISSGYSTKNGLQVGIAAKSVTDIMGNVKPVKVSGNAYSLKYPKQGIEFIIRKKNGGEKVFIIIIKAKK